MSEDRVEGAVFDESWGREYWMMYRRPGFLAVVWFGSSPPPPLPSVTSPRRLRKRYNFLTGEVEKGGGRVGESYDNKEAWSSLNHSVFSGESLMRKDGSPSPTRMGRFYPHDWSKRVIENKIDHGIDHKQESIQTGDGHFLRTFSHDGIFCPALLRIGLHTLSPFNSVKSSYPAPSTNFPSKLARECNLQSIYIFRVQNSVLRLPNYWPPARTEGGHTRWVERGWGVNISEDARHWIGLLQYTPSTMQHLLSHVPPPPFSLV